MTSWQGECGKKKEKALYFIIFNDTFFFGCFEQGFPGGNYIGKNGHQFHKNYIGYLQSSKI